jgi:hypothetical protein
LAELAARQRLSRGGRRGELEGALRHRLDVVVDQPLGEGLRWLGAEIDAGATGLATVRLAFVATRPGPALAGLEAVLRAAGADARPLRRTLAADDPVPLVAGDAVTATLRLTTVVAAGAYRLEVRRGRARVTAAPFDLAPRAPLPSLPRVGRL